MPNLNLRSFNQLVTNGTAAVQSACNQVLDFTTGSVIRSFVEAVAATGLWLQELAFQVLQSARLATSAGSDCDSFAADFGYVDPNRGGAASSGLVTFSRYVATGSAVVPLLQDDGVTPTTVRTFDATQTFTVIYDATNLTFNAAQGGYVLQPNVSSINVPVLCTASGVATNVQANAITLISSNIPGIDTVTNALAFSNGLDGGSDTTFRTHFVNWVNSRSLATKLAVQSATENTQGVVSYSVAENSDGAGNTVLGFFQVTIDDGSGAPSASLIQSVTANVDAVRPFGSSFSVRQPTVITANIVMTITAAPGYVKSIMIPLVQSAVRAYVQGLGVGANLPYTKLIQIAWDAAPGLANVTSVTINGATADLVVNNLTIVHCGTVTVQ